MLNVITKTKIMRVKKNVVFARKQNKLKNKKPKQSFHKKRLLIFFRINN